MPLTPQLGGLLAHRGTTELSPTSQSTIGRYWTTSATLLRFSHDRLPRHTVTCPTKTSLTREAFATAPKDFASALPLTTALIIGDLRRWKTHSHTHNHTHREGPSSNPFFNLFLTVRLYHRLIQGLTARNAHRKLRCTTTASNSTPLPHFP